ncbi:NADH-ubiquinone oxidoreductase-F iron-sulfur binding region domain-containing protein [Candidatus Contubernalis alkaliaceticus]|uniref:NADH-ubiquinone oxidoreductase-F iron-sulfur binding region domain-containing protein n=1 Tax=Candidatus Contubernalis alkaliaceticus TaxID=338645 RepID=UPI001F4BEFDF|nr:NADH-ubiquinone oxidoreductase-F iron-sulfur binding region domain-containing protein [Candidatus Contubernalis alkalaceticus]UNC92430.1 4Fe-4S binding protein [Candidatus Contubernalis alkalaceticus]
MMKLNSPAELEKYRSSVLEKNNSGETSVSVCCGTGCSASGALDVVSAFQRLLEEKGIQADVGTKITGCHGFCEQGPLVLVSPGNILYCQVRTEDVEEIVQETLTAGRIVDRLLYVDPITGEKIEKEEQVPFYNKQLRLIFENNGKMVPTEINDYLSLGGYCALEKVLKGMDPREVIEEIKNSRLRGRGGGGFPTGQKWESCYTASGDIKYVICNADEGDPGCFQDRSILEGNPHLVLEGMLIGAFAVGSTQGYIYVRNEYPLAVKNFSIALRQARELGLLGENILGSDFSYDLKVIRGGGAFVCGESSALISSIEGKIGEPRYKFVHATEKGLWDRPTVLNNVKTWATVPLIINRGSGWFNEIGTQQSKGTMIFSLTGKVNNTGLVEVPMGISLRELIFEIGGGILGGKKFKAVQTGGPSGGCIPEELIDLPLDYEKLTEVGSMVGSGGMIVMDDTTCMVDVAKYFLSFTQEESCGKCVPCREGGEHMLKILEGITRGEGEERDLDLLKEIADTMQCASLCALGKLAPNPVLTTLKYFPEEYMAHIKDKKCPAGVCRELIKYLIDPDSCTGCGRCIKACPTEAITGEKEAPHILNQDQCIKCGNCMDICRFNAITVE